MNKSKIREILRSHKRWLEGVGGKQANLVGANLCGVDLSGVCLARANLRGARMGSVNLQGADLHEAQMAGAYLYSASLKSANLVYANLRGAYLVYANLSDADLLGAKLYGADLENATFNRAKRAELTLARVSTCPEVGAFDGWVKCEHQVVSRVRIPEDARRSSAGGRICRADKVIVVSVEGARQGISTRDPKVVFRVGRVVRAAKWNRNRWVEFGGGIHFFLTRAEAEAF